MNTAWKFVNTNRGPIAAVLIYLLGAWAGQANLDAWSSAHGEQVGAVLSLIIAVLSRPVSLPTKKAGV